MAGLNLKRVTEAFRWFGETVAKDYKAGIIDTQASGELYNSVETFVTVNNQTISVSLLLADYWKYIEDGRLAGSWPPVDAILEWIRVKPILPQPFQLPDGRSVIPTENQLAFLIGRHIFEEGIAPNPVLQESITERKAEFLERLRAALRDDVRDEVKIIFDQLKTT